MFGFGRKSKDDDATPPRDARLAAVDVPRVDFNIVGAMKCGTTTLRRALAAHPEIHIPDGEQHFFGNHRRYLSVWRGGALDRDAFEETYAAQFRTDKPVVGGKTPNYVISTLTLERIQRFHPETKIVFMVRCPVDRAQSHWNHVLRQRDKGQRPAHMLGTTFTDQIERDRVELDRARFPAAEIRGGNILWRGMYAAQLANLRRFFPAERIFVGDVADLKTDSVTFLTGLCSFLGVAFAPEMATAADAGEARAPGHTETLTDDERALVRELYTEPVAELARALGRSFPTWLRA